MRNYKKLNYCVNHGQIRKLVLNNNFSPYFGHFFMTKCIKSARFSLNRMLQVLRSYSNSSRFTLADDFYKDLCWFYTFLDQYNGVTHFDNRLPNHTVHLDASMASIGSIFGNMLYTLPVHHVYQHLHITQLEMLNVVVAFKVWATFWQDKKLNIRCDNLAVVEVLTSGKTKDSFIATGA